MSEVPVIILPPFQFQGGLLTTFKEREGDRICIMGITPYTAMILNAALAEERLPWATPHYAFVEMLIVFEATIEKVVIAKFEGGLYKATTYIEKSDGTTYTIDMTPPDAAILALINGCPIFINEDLFISRDDMDNSAQPNISREPVSEVITDEEAFEMIKELEHKHKRKD